jgi:glycosyltransferase involved in cell wall biosynthesis
MSHKGTIIIISNTHWHSAWQTGNSVAAGFAVLGYHVLFVEPIPKRWPRLTESKRVVGRLTADSHKAGFASQPVPEGVTLISPLALPDVGRLPQFVNRRFFVPRIAAVLRAQLAESGPVVLIHTLPINAAIALQKALNPNVAVYRCVYDWSRDPYSGRKLVENDLLREVDLVWADCEHNLRRLQAVRLDATLMPPAVELKLFTAVTYTQSDHPKPLCVYFGTIGFSRDLDLLRKISHRYRLRLVGPVRQALDGFADGTEIVGPVAHSAVPFYIRDADVLLLPYEAQPHIAGVIPAKLFECLITGKPIVATNLPSVVPYSHLIYLCDGHEAVFEAIEVSRTERESLAAERIACAVENSWEQRVALMEQHIEEVLASQMIVPDGWSYAQNSRLSE